MSELKPFWRKYIWYDWRFGALLIAVVCIPRFVLVLQANQSGNYAPIGAIMFISALVPFLFLSREGRNRIGIRSASNAGGLLLALAAGLVLSFLLYLLGTGLYGDTLLNWYSYIGRSYAIPEGTGGQEKLILFLIYAGTGMVFSPVGEEFFFRGIVHDSVAASAGERRASLVDGLAFAFTHLAHFGLVFNEGTWQFYPIPAILWVASMFAVSLVFIQMKKRTHSIWGAVACHAGFNLGMIWCIFYLLN